MTTGADVAATGAAMLLEAPDLRAGLKLDSADRSRAGLPRA
jgi:hypothetical protein